MKNCPTDNITLQTDNDYIDNIVQDVCDTYEDVKGINHIEGFNLPSETEVETILLQLLEIIFPGYSGKKSLSLKSIKYNVGETLSNVYIELSGQIMRALRYNCAMEHCEHCDIPVLAESAVKSLLGRLAEIRNTMKLDIAAAFDGDPAARSLDEII